MILATQSSLSCEPSKKLRTTCLRSSSTISAIYLQQCVLGCQALNLIIPGLDFLRFQRSPASSVSASIEQLKSHNYLAGHPRRFGWYSTCIGRADARACSSENLLGIAMHVKQSFLSCCIFRSQKAQLTHRWERELEGATSPCCNAFCRRSRQPFTANLTGSGSMSSRLSVLASPSSANIEHQISLPKAVLMKILAQSSGWFSLTPARFKCGVFKL